MNVTFMVDDRMDTANLTFNGVYYLLLGLAGLYFLLSSSTVILGLGCMEKRRRGCAKGFVYPVLLVTSFLSIALAGGVGMGLIIGSGTYLFMGLYLSAVVCVSSISLIPSAQQKFLSLNHDQRFLFRRRRRRISYGDHDCFHSPARSYHTRHVLL